MIYKDSWMRSWSLLDSLFLFFKQGQCARICMVLQAITNAASKVHTLTISAETVTRGIILSKYILRHKLALLADPAPNQPCVSKAVLTKDDLMINKEKISKVLSQNTITMYKSQHSNKPQEYQRGCKQLRVSQQSHPISVRMWVWRTSCEGWK